MKLSKNWTTVTSLSKTLALILFVTLPFIGFYLGMRFTNPSSNTQSTLIPTTVDKPITTINLPSNFKIVATNHRSIQGKSPNYSFKFPEPQNCSGCYDGLGGAPDGYTSQEIVSSGTPNGEGTPNDWVIQNVTLKDGASMPKSTDWFVLNGNFFNELSKINVGQTSTIIATDDKKIYPFTREQDITISGTTAKVYYSSYITRYGKRSKYALFYKDGYTYLLATEWDNSNNYSIFNLITSSFIFSLRPESEVIH